jgi:hypothetical protein
MALDEYKAARTLELVSAFVLRAGSALAGSRPVRAWSLLTQDIATARMESSMAERQPATPTHRAYSVIKREGQDDFWLNLGLAFPHKDGGGFNIILQAFPLDGKIVCREISDDDAGEQPASAPTRREQSRGGQGARRR